MIQFYEQVFRDNGIKVKWAGERRVGIHQEQKVVSREVQDYDLPLLFPSAVNRDLRRHALEYATMISCKALRIKKYLEDYVDKNWIKTILRLDVELLEEYICELVVGKKDSVFCKCGRNSFLLQDGRVIQLHWLDMAMERIIAVKNLCKFKQYPIQMKRIMSEAINIAKIEFAEFATIEDFDDKMDMDKREAEELARFDIPF